VRNRLIAALSGAALLALLSGCAAGNTATGETSGPERVEVTLADLTIDASRSSFEPGKTYEFVITNEGYRPRVPHHPQEEDGRMDMRRRDARGSSAVVEQDQLHPATVTVEYISADTDVHWDGLPHRRYEAGMKMPITLAD
jgi:hypothetical protein